MPSLFVIQGRDQGKRFELEESPITIGRVGENRVRLNDTEVSREHAIIELREDRFFLRDLNSSNGTYVNGKAIRPSDETELRSGDQVQLGRTMLLFTGAREEAIDQADSRVDIIATGRDEGGESRILQAMSQAEGTDLLATPASQTQSPWLARARSNLQLMYRTALAISHTLDIDELLARIMEMIFEWVDADRGCILLKNEETGRLETRVRKHRRGLTDSDSEGDGGKEPERIAISKTILDYVLERREGVLSSNARDDERWDPGNSILKMGVREAICVPMQGRYDVVGLIYIDTSITPHQLLREQKSNKFGEEHLKLMIAIAHQAALAVEDTSYYKAMVQAERLAAVGQTIATLSHHIKNILQGVRGGSYLIDLGMQDHARALGVDAEGNPKELLPDGFEPDLPGAVKAVGTMRKGWGIVEKNQERISGLVMDMLTFSKEREPAPEPSNLNDVAADVVELMQVRADEAGVKLQWRPADEMPTLMFDPEGLHRSLLNLVTNAIDACDECDPAVVTVSTTVNQEAEFAEVAVEDTGIGIEKQDLESIFTVFVSKKGGRGTGLGLAVTQKVMQENGGRVQVTSEPGKGSRFRLELPFNAKPDASDSEELSPGEANPANGPDHQAQENEAPSGHGPTIVTPPVDDSSSHVIS